MAHGNADAARRGEAWLGEADEARQGGARRGTARRGEATLTNRTTWASRQKARTLTHTERNQ